MENTGFSTMTSAIEFADNYNNWILEKFSPFIGNSVMEVGTGQGNFKRYLSKYEVDYYLSLDIDSDVIRRAKERDPEGNYMIADIAEDNFNLKFDVKFSTILICNVLEHIKNHKMAINNLLKLLQPNGYLLLFVPALKGLYNDMDKLAGHYRRYKKNDIKCLINVNEYNIVVNEYFNPIGGLGWFINKFINHNDLDSKAINNQVKFFDKKVVPFSKLLNPVTRTFFGQSLLVVIQKV